MNASAVKAQLKDEVQAFEFGSVDLLTPRSAVAEVRRLRGFIKQMKDVHVAEMARNVHLREEAFTTEEILGMGESEKAEDGLHSNCEGKRANNSLVQRW